MLEAKKLNSFSANFLYSIDNDLSVDNEALIEESFQRKLLIVKELNKWFSTFFKCFFKSHVSVYELINSPLINNFFNSEEFLTNKWCFVHYSINEKGHENISKFFFFALRHSYQNRFELYKSISQYIQYYAKDSNIDFFRKYKNAVIFKHDEQFHAVIDKQSFYLGNEIDTNISCLLNKDILLVFEQN